MRHAEPDPNRPQRGILLDEDIYSGMIHVEVEFWKGFFHQATVEIDQAEDAALAIPYKPSGTLLAMYGRATVEFNGEQYSQVQLLKGIFNFQSVN